MAAATFHADGGEDRPSAKVVLIGQAGVGKSSIARRFINGTFDSTQNEPTMGAAFLRRRVSADPSTLTHSMSSDSEGEGDGDGDGGGSNSRRHRDRDDSIGVPWDVHLWDTAGQERFSTLLPMYYRGADCVVVVADGASLESVRHAGRLIVSVVRSMGHRSCWSISIVASKCDNSDSQTRAHWALQELAGIADEVIDEVYEGRKGNAPWVFCHEVSALTSFNVDDSILYPCRAALLHRQGSNRVPRSSDVAAAGRGAAGAGASVRVGWPPLRFGMGDRCGAGRCAYAAM